MRMGEIIYRYNNECRHGGKVTKPLIEDIIDTDILLMKSTSTVMEAVRKMHEKNTDYALICNDGAPEGIVTERDVISKVLTAGLNPEKVPLYKIMTTPVTTIEKNAEVIDAWNLISESKIKRLIVTENEKVVGVITSFSILSIAPEIFTHEEELSRPEGGFCEFCGNYFPSLNEVEGKFVCDSCKDQLLEE
ncbi:CBS domain-containing protein [archaeon]|nr:MAG: CBS domain-containing protein [archaeon]